MILKKVRVSYSYIGNFLNLLLQNEQRIKNMLLDYEIQSKLDTLPNGVEVKNLLFSKGNLRIRFTPVRVDYEYSLTSPNTNSLDIFYSAYAFFKLLNEIFPDIAGGRIAILSQSFIDNTNNKAIEEFTGKMGFSASFGSCNELSFKFNTPKVAFEDLNAVVNVDMGTAKNNASKEEIKVLLLTIDVNTKAEQTTARFNPGNFKTDFKDLYSLIEERTAELERY